MARITPIFVVVTGHSGGTRQMCPSRSDRSACGGGRKKGFFSISIFSSSVSATVSRRPSFGTFSCETFGISLANI